MASRRVRDRRCGLARTARSLRGWLPAVAGIWLAAAPVAVECAQFRPRATVRLVATGSTIANHPAGRLTADELANLIPAVERYAEVETEQFANLPNSSLTGRRVRRLRSSRHRASSPCQATSGIDPPATPKTDPPKKRRMLLKWGTQRRCISVATDHRSRSRDLVYESKDDDACGFCGRRLRRPSGVVNALSTTVQSPPNAARAFSTPRQNPQAARTRLDDRG